MTRIYGTNDRKTLEERRFPYYQFQIYKGTKKIDGNFGDDLGYKFRLELSNNGKKPRDFQIIKNILSNSYQVEEDKNGSLFLDNLNLVLYSDAPEITFFSALATYKNNKPIWFCDKKNIHTKFVGDRGRPVKVSEPCHAKSLYDKCSKGCKEFGSFYFEILELRLLDFTRVCRMQLSSIKDIINISEYLDKTKKEIGTIRTSPFYSTKTQRFIVHRLTRISKVNSYKKINYPLHLELHPIWLKEYNSFLHAEQIKSLGYAVPKKLLAQIHGTELIEIDSSIPLLESSWKPSQQDIQKIKSLYYDYNWNSEELFNVMRSHFGIEKNKIKEAIASFDRKQFKKFKTILERNDD